MVEWKAELQSSAAPDRTRQNSMSTQPDSTPAATAEAPDKGVGCDALLAGLRTLALRAYPELKSSRICSRHRDQGHYECTICYPDWHALLSEHMRVSGELYDQLLAHPRLRGVA